MQTKPGRLHSRFQRGNALVIVTLFIVTLFGFAALSIDVSHVFQQQRRVQIGTDAAALAAVALLTNSAVTANAVRTEALNIALANGISNAEITASSIGSVQVGQWSTNSLTFTANATPYNAVLVPARRTVSMYFGQVVGISQMTPSVQSVAFLTYPCSAPSPIPFGIGTSLMVGKDFVTNNIVVIDGKQSPGNWGKLDAGGINTSSKPAFIDAMQNALNGTGATLSLGENGVGTGVAGLGDGFQVVEGDTVIIPIVNTFLNGNAPITIVGFVLGIPLSVVGNGANAVVTIKLVPGLINGSGTCGPSGPPFAQARELVR